MNQKNDLARGNDERGQTIADRWIEPFYDLVIGTVIGQLADVFTGAVYAKEYLHFCSLFIPAWWLWTGFSLYFDRFDRNARFQQALLLLSLVPIILLSVKAPDTLEGDVAGFTWFYAAARILLVGLYVYTIWVDEEARKPARHLLIGYSVGLVFWIVGGITQNHVWQVVSLVIELTTPWLARKSLEKIGPTEQHFPQRLGMFTLIVVEQNIMGISTSLSEGLWHSYRLIAAGCGLILVILLWWWYFFHQEEFLNGRLKGNGLRYSFGHLPLYLGTGTMAIGVTAAIDDNDTSWWMLVWGMTLYLAAMTWMSLKKINAARRRPYVGLTGITLALMWSAAYLIQLGWETLVAITGIYGLYLLLAYRIIKDQGEPVPDELSDTEDDSKQPLQIG
ncbi:hypothetical protein BWI97_23605 [Siphonobacter sp. BAB-5405]|uniref:low temperature requirement protein A n=1 Tax=Siphonobacter sp. BAB-5405 TaxID=1864825 RepID=UPI000C8048D1|nr:low temperature requirement protein A [Siphonobacter sp. BAB-5405]PMD90463.1 hypothetical protein BWI97_23605 [Siphonobacter sp. BAB-5405]